MTWAIASERIRRRSPKLAAHRRGHPRGAGMRSGWEEHRQAPPAVSSTWKDALGLPSIVVDEDIKR
ncbi:MAG: hypothetical protein MZU79_05820 [Anaerotruncus sp.]|nr:hypothetical protein [Anaerotruncus sp.]